MKLEHEKANQNLYIYRFVRFCSSNDWILTNQVEKFRQMRRAIVWTKKKIKATNNKELKVWKCEEIKPAVCRFSVSNQWVLLHGGPCASWLPSENGKFMATCSKKYLLINHDWCRWLAERVIFSTRLNTVLQFLVITFFQIIQICWCIPGQRC